MKKELEALMKALQAGGTGGGFAPDEFTGKLLQTFTRLKLSNIDWIYPMKFEGLEAILKSGAYDSSKIKYYKGKKK